MSKLKSFWGEDIYRRLQISQNSQTGQEHLLVDPSQQITDAWKSHWPASTLPWNASLPVLENTQIQIQNTDTNTKYTHTCIKMQMAGVWKKNCWPGSTLPWNTSPLVFVAPHLPNTALLQILWPLHSAGISCENPSKCQGNRNWRFKWSSNFWCLDIIDKNYFVVERLCRSCYEMCWLNIWHKYVSYLDKFLAARARWSPDPKWGGTCPLTKDQPGTPT